ncbi:amino acid/amide ABC transporter ATP-binding protein 2, HAAT family [Roseovarius lutimaris]|uniref:Amino acid/amide ABC transporter ATP-binding protein 2, HAAT family n=1 Tax=Roseovarius lutimaris TaxID=1005928 RepID=A0A1I5GSH2_9RHOB|nr:ABC transporter ATP-binding protein [Roseovarius lutimaris]SFO38887.1 amino acid/amide ABC transporter ATP-binding protein 2, HAAT family [Roseovarius lutimaris]
MTSILEVKDIEVVYNRAIHVLKGVSLNVPEKGIAALLGGNGVGKSTTLKAISNLLKAERGAITHGDIRYKGESLLGWDPADIVRSGIFQVMEGRRLFQHLTVEENLRAGAYSRRVGDIKPDLERVYNYFPRLGERRAQKAGYLSGGEQQMAAIGRALMARPKVILLDEPSMGLAPILVTEIFEILRVLCEEENVSMLLAEQNAHMALSIVSEAYVMESGRIISQGATNELTKTDIVRKSYLGMTEEDNAHRAYRQILLQKRAAGPRGGTLRPTLGTKGRTT